MRRIDVLAVGFGIFMVGGLLYAGLQVLGLDAQQAGIWSQLGLMLGLLGWLASYFLRVLTGGMTYNQQRDDYEAARLEQRLQQMTPEELAALSSDLEQEQD